MKRVITFLLFTLALLIFVACNNKKVSTQLKTVSPDTTQSFKPLSGEISLDKLPINIKEYVNKHYPGYAIKKAAYDPLCTGEDAMDIAISKQDSPDYSLIFLFDGTFVQLEEDIDLSKAPAKVLETVKAKYADFQPAHKIESLTLADKSIAYLVDLTKGTLTKEVILKADGTIVCEQ